MVLQIFTTVIFSAILFLYVILYIEEKIETKDKINHSKKKLVNNLDLKIKQLEKKKNLKSSEKRYLKTLINYKGF